MNKCILIVEDENICFKVSKIFFEMCGCEIEHAESGEDALQLFTQRARDKSPYRAVYMDIGLPNMNGIETCIAIRKFETDAALSPVPIIAVTGNNDPEVINACLSAGMINVFAKPLTEDKVLDFLSQCHL
jgi:CheY-like chemotaxis protein